MSNDWTTEVYAGVYLGGTSMRTREIPEVLGLDLHNEKTWDVLFESSMGTDAGVHVDEDRALMYAPVWQAVNLISSAVACLPFHHYRQLPDVSATASERLYSTQDYLISVSPSGGVEPDDYQTAVQFWESFMVDVLLWNNGYAWIEFDAASRPQRLVLLNPDRTACERIDGRLWYTTEYDDGKVKALYPWEVLHVRGTSAGVDCAPAFIKYARNSIALGLAQQKFASKFFAHGGRVGGILEIPAGVGKVARDTIEEGFRKSYEGADNPFKTVILRESAKFHQAQTSPTDAQMVEGTQEQIRMIARWFGLSPALLGLSGSVSYNSKEQDNQAFLDHCLKRWLRKIQAECGIKLLPPKRQQSEFFRHDVSDLISMDAAKKAQAHAVYIQSRVLNPNEVRGELGMLPYEGGDEYANPATATTPANPEPQPGSAPDPQAQPTPPDAARKSPQLTVAEKRNLISCTLNARHKAKNPKAFIEFAAKCERSTEWQVAVAATFDEIVNTSTPNELQSTVDRVCGQLETIYLGE
jgi:HK97 family phage portal protein